MSAPEVHVSVGSLTLSNETGLQLAEEPGVWFNRSKAQFDPTHGEPFPPVGSAIEIGYIVSSNRRYVQSVTVLAAPAAPPAVQTVSRAVQDDRPVVTRLACLKAAVATWRILGRQTLAPYDLEAEIRTTADHYVAWVTGIADAEIEP